MTRFLSFRFDDGFIEGARKSIAILGEDRASFFVATGLWQAQAPAKARPTFEGRDFGDLRRWTRISRSGHDVQPHSVSHQNFSEIDAHRQVEEARASLAQIMTMHRGPYVFCFPFNAISTVDLPALGFSAAGFDSRPSDHPIQTNDLTDVDLFRLKSWAVRERHLARVKHELATVPDDHWIVLGFHSLDGEGHEPWSSAAFADLVDFVRRQGFAIRTVRAMVESLAAAPGVRSSVLSRLMGPACSVSAYLSMGSVVQ